MSSLQHHRIVILLAFLLVLTVAGCASQPFVSKEGELPVSAKSSTFEETQQSTVETAERVEKGDLVKVNYTASLENGKVATTTVEAIYNDTDRPKVDFFNQPAQFEPVQLRAGEQEVFPGLGEAVVGLQVGERRTTTVPPEQAFGLPSPQKMKQMPCEKKLARVVHLSANEYVQRFGTFPVLGKKIGLTPFFFAEVVEVTEQMVVLEQLAVDGEISQTPFGTTTITVDEDEVSVKLDPELGAPFQAEGQIGRIISTDGINFTVDFNHPLAGRTISLEVEAVAITKASELEDVHISWIEDHDQALEKAEQVHKPLVMALYAEWCTWSQRLLTETFEDPRIKSLNDRFVWAKINSNQQPEYKMLYEQNGFPMIVLMSTEGEVIKKLDGFRKPADLEKELQLLLGDKEAVKS